MRNLPSHPPSLVAISPTAASAREEASRAASYRRARPSCAREASGDARRRRRRRCDGQPAIHRMKIASIIGLNIFVIVAASGGGDTLLRDSGICLHEMRPRLASIPSFAQSSATRGNCIGEDSHIISSNHGDQNPRARPYRKSSDKSS